MNAPCADLPSSEVLKSARPDSISFALVRLAERGDWKKLDQFLIQLDQLSEIRGAVLMRALNVPAPARAHRLLPSLIHHGAPAEVIRRAIALGALPSGNISIRETCSSAPLSVTTLHFAVMKNRFDIASLLIGEGHRPSALNEKGETAPEQFARVAPKSALGSESVVLGIGSLVRKAIADGMPLEHMTRLIGTLCTRRAWSAMETVIDQCVLQPERNLGGHIPRSAISQIAWAAALRRAPSSSFEALQILDRSGLVVGEPSVPSGVRGNFLADCIPQLGIDRTVEPGSWNAFASRLAMVEAAAELTPPDFVAGIVNASYPPFIQSRQAGDLVELGIEDPPKLTGVWSLLHVLCSNDAPLSLVDRVVRLGPDLGLTALIEDNDEIVCDGTPLHLACAAKALEFINLLLRHGAPTQARNSCEEIPLQTFLKACGDELGLSQIATIGSFLRAGSPIENRSSLGLELESHAILGIPLRRLVELVDEYAARLAEGGIQPRLPAITLHYLIEESGKLVEVDEVRVRTIALARLERILGSRFAGVKRTMLQAAQLDDLLRIGAMRNAIETLYRIRQSPEGETFQKGPPEAALDENGGWGADEDVLFQSQDPWEEADHDSGWLEFPNLGLSESSEVIENELAIENVPEHAAHANDPPDSFIDDELPALVDEGGFGPGATAAGKAAESAIVSLFSGSYDTRGDQQSYLDTAARFLTDGSPHETYLMLEAIHEVTATAPRPLNATTRALRTLLFRAPPGTAQYLGVLLDRSGYFRANGFHPYMAEYLCLLNHPFDERKDIATIGGLSLGISSVGRLARFGSMRGDLLYEYGRIGALNFSFPFWRFDAQPIRLSGDNTTLFEQAGMGRRQHPATEYWTNPVTAKEEHLWGPIFAVAPGDEFHRSFKNDEAKRLGYAPLALNTSVVFRRAGIFTGTDYGVMLWRNSSLQFGRDRFQHPAMVCTDPMSAKEICELTPKDIDKRFHSVTGEAYFSGVTQRKIKFRSDGKQPPRAGDAVAVAAMELKHFSDQFQTVRAKYSRMKFDTHLETAWSSDGKRLLGGYRSPLFPAVVSQLEDRFNRRPSGGQPAIEHLAVSNPDYPPYAPHAVLQINERSLECLRLLADGKDSKVSSRSLRETGLEEFLNVAFTRGRNSELVMMPARE